MSPWLLPTIAVTVSVVAAITDLRTGRIPNLLTFPAMLLGLVLNGYGHGIMGLLGGLIGIVVCTVAPGIVYKASQGRGIGGGDLKLFAALGALLGPTQGLEAELSSFRRGRFAARMTPWAFRRTSFWLLALFPRLYWGCQ